MYMYYIIMEFETSVGVRETKRVRRFILRSHGPPAKHP